MYEPTQKADQNTPHVAVDAVLFSIDKKKLRVLLIKLKDGPYKGTWCLPGGLVHYNESLEDAVKNRLFQKTNVSGIYLEQLYTFGDPNRDKRWHSVAVAYFALVNNPRLLNIRTSAYHEEIDWKDITNLPELAFDHKEIIKTAHQRLKAKTNYSNIVYSLLPSDFTLTQLQGVYETITQEKLDKRNFRKRILSLNFVEKSNKKLVGQPFRPAQLFHFTQKKLTLI